MQIPHPREAETKHGLTARFHAISTPLSFDLKIFRQLLADGLNPDIRNAEGEPLLHILAQLESEPAISAAIAAGADVTARDAEGNTALAMTDSVACALLLMQHGLSPSATNSNGKTPAEYLRAKHAKIGFLQQLSPIIELLYNCTDMEKSLAAGHSPMQAWAAIWDEAAGNYLSPTIVDEKFNALPYLLHQSQQCGQPLGKSDLNTAGEESEWLRAAIASSPLAAVAWRDHCAAQGQSMTPQDWLENGLDRLQKSGQVSALFTGAYWQRQPSLKGLYDLMEILPHKGQRGLHPNVAAAVSETINDWCKQGPGAQLPSAGLARLHRQMPEHVREAWQGYHSLYLTRYDSERQQGVGR